MRQSPKGRLTNGQKFSDRERASLLEVRGVGPTVIQRLEELGICSLEALRGYDAEEITAMVASTLGSSCWKNSPQARHAISAAIEMADQLVLESDAKD